MEFKTECLPYEGLRNARDLGGIPTADGRVIKKGKLIRSGRLYKLPEKTVAALKDMGVDNVIDLRMEREIYEHKPTILGGVTYHYLPFICTAEADMVTVDCMMSTKVYRERKRLYKEFKNADEYMKATYKLILFSPVAKKQLKEIFDLFIAEENTILWHCNSGKDRTGIVTMLLLGVLGVPRETILDDYELSYYFLRRRRRVQRFLLAIVPASLRYKRLLCAMMFSKREYMQSALDEIDKRYGGIVGYVKNALGVTDGEIEILKQKYLTEGI